MIQEFKKFLIKWNAVDIAVWFVFGAAFATLVKSFVSNIILPPIGLLLWKVDFSNLFIALDWKDYKSLAELEKAGAPAIKYWVFINDLITFLILGFVIFILVKFINNLQKKDKETKKPAAPSQEVVLLQEIRDLLKNK